MSRGNMGALKDQRRGKELIEAFRPTAEQVERGEFPPYAQIVLRTPFSASGTTGSVAEIYCDEHMSWAIRDALARAQSPQSGSSIVEQLEKELDIVYNLLMHAINTPGLERDPEDVGVAQGLAVAIMKMRNVSIDEVRAQARERWEAQR